MQELTIDINNKVIAGFTVVVFLVISVLGAVFFIKYRNMAKALADPSFITKEQARELIAKVGKIMALPAGEDPVIVTITDINKTDKQPFYAKAKNGDKVLVFTRAKKAILYDPVTNQVKEVGPLIIPESTEQGNFRLSQPTLDLSGSEK